MIIQHILSFSSKVIHFQRFGEALNYVQALLDSKKFY
ncbi:hypothetical protein PTH_0141 [Pelotomaculum thermopropionicum SI]|uniref:Uncharacterized protein n=1 Tax=Pelotomaculum thermopropionicum (strain DSM 13744 / JCM 10971 / SI) TaxID=370438 RepID=A5D625_PELTS|nr:hypothetical protein PTH_0141 [Pelotomaculum thermopropionicum SI]